MKTERIYKNAIFAASAALVLMVGCSVNVKKDEEGRDKNVEVKSPIGDIKVNKEGGKDKNVSIRSPFGNLNVDTEKVSASDIGLSVYPGATEAPDEEHNQSKANVNIDSPWFTLKVQALKYKSNDSQDKIWEYYKKELKKYGRVLECKPGSPDMNYTKKNDDDLTCHDDEKNGSKKVNLDMDRDSIELRVGTKQSFRVVGMKQDGKGSSFALVRIRMKEDSKDAN